MSATRFAATDPLTAEEIRSAELRSLPRPSRLERPVALTGPAAEAAAALGIETVGDLLEHLPRDHRHTRTVASLGVGEQATVAVTIRSVRLAQMRNRRKKSVEARVFDPTGPMVAVWFNQPWLAKKLTEGTEVLLHGKLRGANKFWVSGYELLAPGQAHAQPAEKVPVYGASAGISPDQLRSLTRGAYDRIGDVVEPLPGGLRARERMPDRPAAIAAAHFPEVEGEHYDARRRLAFEELFLLELALAGRKRARAEGARAPELPGTGELVAPWLAKLPFEPTGDQRKAFERIDRDLASSRPMQRLLMGEVGSGKTVCALHAMLRASESGHQAAFMAPTETLAEQHMATIDRLLGGLVPVGLLTGATPARRRRELLERLASGELGMIVGTHALIEPTVEFRALGVVVVDEQHRFGVRQRAALDAKGREGLVPHALHMTATPIPRTLALTAYGDLDVTVLRELPAGRLPVETHAVDGARARARAYERIREEIAKGRQCFVVCPLVEESETLQAKAATAEAERLATTEFRDLRVELIHGQMPSKSKQAAMSAFAAGEADVLVATSVIEVGIDVPNATVMLIEAAERYGISQLHQLRGRIGRGGHESVCILFGDPSLPRIAAVAKERDGFKLAEVDLQIRGEGALLGTRQHGLPEFKVAQLPDDLALLERARERATELLGADPRLQAPENALLREATVARFGSDMDPIPA